MVTDQGDLWVDTNDNYKIWAWTGSAWVLAQDWKAAKDAADAAMAKGVAALAAAANAQGTADGKIQCYYQATQPTGLDPVKDIGDL